MKRMLSIVKGTGRLFNIIAGITLVFVVALTTADVILRAFQRPIRGTYEIVGFSGSIVILFALPFTSWLRGHIFVDFLVNKFSQKGQAVFNVITRCLVFCLFFLFGWNMFKYGLDLQRTAEVSVTLKIPFYPVVFAGGICCFLQCLVLLCDIVKISGGEYE
jgi:TRAP-type C4-dicarboxylate transport system permease small subunit